MLKVIRDFFYGLAFGIIETIPGVSGGTIAIILGYYFELIKAINHFAENLKKNLQFLVPLVIGIVTGILVFSSIVSYLLVHYSFPTMLFFIGLVAGIIPHIFSKILGDGQSLRFKDIVQYVKRFSLIDIVLIVIPFLVLLIISLLKGVSAVHPEDQINTVDASFMIFIFFSGVLGAVALVIPGISGSFVLLLLGIYPLAIYALSQVRVFLGDISNIQLMLKICKVVAPLGIGIVVGGLTMTRIIEKLLKNYQKTVYSVIFGLLLGSVCALFKNPIVYRSGVSAIIIAMGAVTFSLGCLLSFKVGKNRL